MSFKPSPTQNPTSPTTNSPLKSSKWIHLQFEDDRNAASHPFRKWKFVLFLEVVEVGITSLREKCGTKLMGIDGELQCVFDSMCNNVNYESIVREWATAARTRFDRNAASHPFSGLITHEECQIAINYFGSLVNGPYCEKFRNVALLGKLQLQLVDIKESSSLEAKNVEVVELL